MRDLQSTFAGRGRSDPPAYLFLGHDLGPVDLPREQDPFFTSPGRPSGSIGRSLNVTRTPPAFPRVRRTLSLASQRIDSPRA